MNILIIIIFLKVDIKIFDLKSSQESPTPSSTLSTGQSKLWVDICFHQWLPSHARGSASTSREQRPSLPVSSSTRHLSGHVLSPKVKPDAPSHDLPGNQDCYWWVSLCNLKNILLFLLLLVLLLLSFTFIVYYLLLLLLFLLSELEIVIGIFRLIDCSLLIIWYITASS